MSANLNTFENIPIEQRNIDLAPYNTLGVQAKAQIFYSIAEAEQLKALYNEGLFRKKSPFILGGGSNILIKSDLKQPVLKILIPGIEVIDVNDREVWVKAGAGVVWHDLVRFCVENGYGGIENLALIPGTTGAAPIQNIGAYGVELKDVFQSLSAFMPETGNMKVFNAEECKFGYRDSVFKNQLKGKVIVTDVTLRLEKGPHKIEDSYYALRKYFESENVTQPTIQDVFDAVVSIRRSKLPDPALIGNAGSFFKNPIVSKEVYENLKNEFSDIPSFPADQNRVKIPAGWLIEQAGWKGKKVGNVGTYKNQALVLVNHGGATGEEVYEHAMNIQESVKSLFGIELVPEVNVIE
ncbi:UDP-N-acetylenolpyruvoylglucosamine reductase [Rhodohalobacter barkolensis]|uniref:UDP-N-acetylenolpyruvoylglucosamine reductase n=1 Tax=Rhodohalobacter barkolensis TaxID=2053187 RepID=A0A2N0VM83_9BACT|nr:UDP-N-acetylenolpyruvoylglucosamine reductase [Rhodohalobacter barkolensis]